VCVCVCNVDTIDFLRMYVEGEVIHITFMEIQYYVFHSVCFQKLPLSLPYLAHAHGCHDSNRDVAVTNCKIDTEVASAVT
jgi:hypothetical protein